MRTVQESLEDKVALVTGANTGIGFVTARELARRGARVFIACRSGRAADAARQRIRAEVGASVECLPLDLGDFDSVGNCAGRFLMRGMPLHILVNNAGVGGARGLTRSGFELAFGVNHMGHVLLTRLLLETIKRSAPARIVTVASRAHCRAPGIDWDALQRSTRTLTGIVEYQVSKLANVLFSAELGRRLQGTGVTTYALHPGVVRSDFWRRVPALARPLLQLRPMISVEDGARSTLVCASSPELASETACYYAECRKATPSPAARDVALASELWQRSLAWTA